MQGPPHGRPKGFGRRESETDMTTAQIEWIYLDRDALRVGDLVSAAAGGLPTYRVVALAGREAWVRDEDHAATRLVPLGSLRWKAAASGHGLY